MSLTREQRQFIRERRAELTREVAPYRKEFVPRPPPQAGAKLSRRELQVLCGAADGFSYPQIAVRLGLGETTVKHYSKTLRIKLDARTMTQAAVVAVQRGLLEDVPG